MRDRQDPGTKAWGNAALALSAAFWLLDLLVLRAGAADPLDDTWEYGVAARAILHGFGLRTWVIHPPLFGLIDAHGTVPILVHGPLLPMLMLPFVAFGGAHALDGVAWLAAIFATLAALATFRLGSRTLSAPVAFAAAMLVTLSPLMLRAVHHDIALPLGAWLLALALDQTLRTRPHAARAGMLLGLGALVRPEFLIAAPVLLWQVRGARARFAVVLGAVLLPWAWHGYANAGAPFFNLSSYLIVGYWGAHPGIGIMRDFALPPHQWRATWLHALPGLAFKWFDFLPHALKAAFSTPSVLTGCLAPIGAVGAMQSPRSRPLAQVALVLIVIPIVVMTLTLYDPRYLTPFLPLLALGAAQGAREVANVLPAFMQKPRVWLSIVVALMVITLVPALITAQREGVQARARLASERRELAAFGAHDGFAWSDTPDFVAWITKRPTIWVTAAEYSALPLAENAAPGAPARLAGELTWFHASEGRGAALPGALPAGNAPRDSATAPVKP
jgi:hypothetical protein